MFLALGATVLMAASCSAGRKAAAAPAAGAEQLTAAPRDNEPEPVRPTDGPGSVKLLARVNIPRQGGKFPVSGLTDESATVVWSATYESWINIDGIKKGENSFLVAENSTIEPRRGEIHLRYSNGFQISLEILQEPGLLKRKEGDK